MCAHVLIQDSGEALQSCVKRVQVAKIVSEHTIRASKEQRGNKVLDPEFANCASSLN
jgi:hypothetical protein